MLEKFPVQWDYKTLFRRCIFERLKNIHHFPVFKKIDFKTVRPRVTWYLVLSLCSIFNMFCTSYLLQSFYLSNTTNFSQLIGVGISPVTTLTPCSYLHKRYHTQNISWLGFQTKLITEPISLSHPVRTGDCNVNSMGLMTNALIEFHWDSNWRCIKINWKVLGSKHPKKNRTVNIPREKGRCAEFYIGITTNIIICIAMIATLQQVH